MPEVITWEDILLHPQDYIGRDFRILIGASGNLYRGPIVKIDDAGPDFVNFELAWSAYLAPDGRWHKREGTKVPFPKRDVSLVRMDDGQINLMPQFVRVAGMIFPPGDNLSALDVLGFGPLN